MDDSFELEYADELEALEELQCDTPKLQIKHDVSSHKITSLRDAVIASSHLHTSFDESILGHDIDNRSISQDEDISLNLSSYSDIYEQSSNLKRKRLQEEHWDLEEETVSNSQTASQKRFKISEEQEKEEAILQKILQQRAVTHNSSIDQYRLNDGDDTERKRVSRRIPQCDFVSVRSYEGESVYLKLWNGEVLESEYDSLGNGSRASKLLSSPVCVLREQIMEQYYKENESSNQTFDGTDDVLGDVAKENSGNVTSMLSQVDDTDLTGDADREKVGIRSLWVEKYAPRKYTELLSEEGVNRSLLHWIRLWDFVVFNKEVPKIKKTDKSKDSWKFKNKKTEQQVDISESLDKFHRPQQKVALLCGPPGLGKTTLAHIVARHAGYNVVEMNASDDRSVDVFNTKLESATQMKAVLGADDNPNCLVIDEIDGAPAPAINVLLNLIKKAEADEPSNKKKKKGLLKRPIICICNDQYVPALRQLRQAALLLNFPQTEASRLASRLYEVVQVEELKADVNTLLALCERTENDIRSCLNTLQFVHQKQKELSLQTVRTMSVGQKDSQKSLFAVWHDVFTMPREKKNRFISIHDLTEGNRSKLQTTNLTPQSRFNHVLHMVQSAGEYERLMQGLFENYLLAKSKDPHLLGLTRATDWLVFVDSLNHYIAKSQDYSVAKYTSYLSILFHFLYASFNPQRLQFPHSQNEAKQKQGRMTNLMTSMMSDMTPLTRIFVSPDSMVLDLLPPLMDVLLPTMRPVNTLLYSNREKEELANVVRIMISYNITYRQEKSLEGQYNYVLDPNVEEVVQFPDMKQQRRQLTYAAKQMIAREIDIEKMRRDEKGETGSQIANTNTKSNASTIKNTPASNQSLSNKSKEQNDATCTLENQQDQPAAVPNHLVKLEAKKINDHKKSSFNFFGNFKKTKRETTTASTKTDDGESSSSSVKSEKDKRKLLETVIWFHFKEGYSNAVRRTVKVKDLL